jgi:hypothetical protein
MLYTAATNANASNAILANASLSQWRAPGNGRVVSAHFIAALAATAAGGNNATIAAIKLHANGFSNIATASQTTNTSANGGTGNLVIGVPAALTVTDKANARFTRGTVIAPQVSMNSSGVAMGAGTLELVVELEQPWDEAS